MEQKYIYLRPTSDLGVFDQDGNNVYNEVLQNGVYPPGSASLYNLISEEVPDQAATYIKQIANDKKVEKTYIFGIDTKQIPTKIKTSNVTVSINCYQYREADDAKIYPLIYINDVPYTGVVKTGLNGVILGEVEYITPYREDYDGYPDFGTSVFFLNDSAIEAINEFINKNKKFPDIKISFRIVMEKPTTDGKENEVRLSWTQITIFYEDKNNIGIFDKVNGLYKAATVAYKKNGGTWTEISENECKEILKNNTIRRG